jgi:hypothetical protein
MAWFSSDKMTLILMPLFTIGLFNRLASGRYELPASLYSIVLRYWCSVTCRFSPWMTTKKAGKGRLSLGIT